MKFPLHPELRPFAGVDITHTKIRLDEEVWDEDMTRVWERWAKNFMRLTDSHYQYLQLLINVKVISFVERNDTLNPFQWIHDKLNIPGDKSSTPKLPCVIKVRSEGAFRK